MCVVIDWTCYDISILNFLSFELHGCVVVEIMLLWKTTKYQTEVSREKIGDQLKDRVNMILTITVQKSRA